jgi:hypothetical protein
VNSYLEKFPEEYRQFVHNRFSQAYVFSEQSFEYGTDDQIDLAKGPRALKERVVECCLEMRQVVPAAKQAVLDQIVATIDESDELAAEVRREIEERWKEAREFSEAHPRKSSKPVEKPTEAQLGYLKKLGCSEVPASKSEATQLIDKYKERSKPWHQRSQAQTA